MKIEDINYNLPTNKKESKTFDEKEWLEENPVDYFKFLFLFMKMTDEVSTDIPRDLAMNTVFKYLYSISRRYIPDTLYKFYSLTDDKNLNEKKLSTLQNKQIFMSKIKDFNDPYDSKAFFYDPNELSYIKP